MKDTLSRFAIRILLPLCRALARSPEQRRQLDELMPILDRALKPELYSTEELRAAREQLKGL